MPCDLPRPDYWHTTGYAARGGVPPGSCADPLRAVDLRRYYRQHRRRSHLQAVKLHGAEWEVDLVLNWLFLFGVPPFDRFYGELPEGARCPCGQAHGYTRGGVEFAGGRTWICGACTREWLVRRPRSGLANEKK